MAPGSGCCCCGGGGGGWRGRRWEGRLGGDGIFGARAWMEAAALCQEGGDARYIGGPPQSSAAAGRSERASLLARTHGHQGRTQGWAPGWGAGLMPGDGWWWVWGSPVGVAEPECQRPACALASRGAGHPPSPPFPWSRVPRGLYVGVRLGPVLLRPPISTSIHPPGLRGKQLSLFTFYQPRGQAGGRARGGPGSGDSESRSCRGCPGLLGAHRRRGWGPPDDARRERPSCRGPGRVAAGLAGLERFGEGWRGCGARESGQFRFPANPSFQGPSLSEPAP